MNDIETKVKRDMEKEGEILKILLILMLVTLVFALGLMVGMK